MFSQVKSLLSATIEQIKRKAYPSKIAENTGDILLVGINYDKETKQHTCKIERLTSLSDKETLEPSQPH